MRPNRFGRKNRRYIFSDLSISYLLIGDGWSECHIKADGDAVTISASYLSDALGSLSRAVLVIAKGGREAHASFDEEPGEYRWVFNRFGDAKVFIRILEFPDLRSMEPDEAGEVIFEYHCPIETLVRCMVGCLADVLSNYGEEGYKEEWIEHDFPMQSYELLRSFLPVVSGQ